mmetsp:Transcript_27102/g.49406  ORF Transcript_27102/g.49406 Transcript_27102/m.49406 type:complete len:201 (-) Transcript_27102:1137-1739(-)
MIHVKVAKVHSRIRIRMAATLIGAAAIFAHVHARRINSEGQVNVNRLLRRKNPAKAFARLHRHVDACHLCGPRRAGPRGIDHLPARDDVPTGQCDAFHPGARCISGHRDHFVLNIFHAAFTRLTPPPVKDGGTVPISFIHRVDGPQNNVVDIIKRIGRLDLIRCHQLGGRPRCMLHHRAFAQSVCKLFGIGEIHIAKVAD